MSAHTKGPWQAMPRFQDHIEVRHSCPREGAASSVVARVTVRRTWENEQTANARLVAAAPELLEALEGLLNALPSATTHPSIAQARRALAKVRGES